MQLTESAATAAQLPPREEAAPVAPVRLRGRMTRNGYEAENSAWKPFPTHPDKRLGKRADGGFRLAGHNPLKLSLDTLRKSGHPNRSTRLLVRALGNPSGQHAGNEEGDPMDALSEIRAYRDIPAYCDGCAGGSLLRRECATINCPFWPIEWGATRTTHSGALKPGLQSEKATLEARLIRKPHGPLHVGLIHFSEAKNHADIMIHGINRAGRRQQHQR